MRLAHIFVPLYLLSAVAEYGACQTYPTGAVLNSPECIRLAGATLEKPDEQVIGVGRANEYCAYTIKMMAYHRIVNDHLGGPPIVVAYDPVSCMGAVYDPVLDGKPYTFIPAGSVNGVPAIQDEQTRSKWLIATGAAIDGPLKGRVMKRIPSVILVNSRWMQLHADSWTLKEDPAQIEHYVEATAPALVSMPNAAVSGGVTARDRRLAAGELVFGLSEAPIEHAWTLKMLARAKSVTTQNSSDGPIVVLYDSAAEAAAAYRARVGGRTLHFIPVYAGGVELYKDLETGSSWNIEGVAIAGPLAKTALQSVPFGRSRWFAWSALYPKSKLN